jgi:hypothetical protein
VLDITFNSGAQPQYTHLTNARDSAIQQIQYNGLVPGVEGQEFAEIPNNQYAVYLQDAWRIGDKLTLDLGLRYDLVTGFAFDQTDNLIFSELQAAARAGLLQGMVGLEDFGQEGKEDKNNISPRAGFTYDVNADGTFVVRGGAGRYYDFAYTNANLLFPVYGAQVPFGQVYLNTNSAGVRNADGSLFQVGQPLPPNQLTNLSRPVPSNVGTPLPKQPYTDQANLGFSKSLGKSYAIELDAVYAEGHDLGIRPRLNVRINGGPRRLAGILPQSGASDFRTNVPRGRSHYKGVSIAFKKRWDGKLQLLTSYTLSRGTSLSRRATDEFGDDELVNAFDPFGDVQEGPTQIDSTHKVTASALWSPGAGITIAPIYRYRSATPFTVITGFDDNRDGRTFDLPAGSETVNQARGADFSQLDVRLSKRFRVGQRANLDVIVEGFNLFNDTNPARFGPQTGSIFNQRTAAGAPPVATRFAGDFRQFEQRLAQLGIRIEF